jgi:hypothetical protein
MGCGCNKTVGDWEIVNADGTVQPTTYPSSGAAQTALVAQRTGGYVRQKARQNA